MHNLRSALGRQDEAQEASLSRLGPSRMHNKSKSATIWALDPDENEEDKPATSSKSINHIEALLSNAYKKDPIFTEMAFYEVVELVQAQSVGSQEMESLTKIQSTIHALSQKAEDSFKDYLNSFMECLIRRIKKLRRKQKKHELQQFDKIVQTNFKRKGAAFIDEDNPDKNKRIQEKEEKINRKYHASKDHEGSSKKNGSSSSTEGKLGQLLSNSKIRDEKKQSSNKESQAHQQSVSFSAVISQNMTVRQRRAKEPVKKEKEKDKQKGEEKAQLAQSQGKDEAFIFYRPKAGKRK